MFILNNYKQFTFFITSLLLISCNNIKEQNINGQTMGTFYTIKYVSNIHDIKNIKVNINKRLEEINRQMSTYNDNSEVSKFNKFKKTNIPFPVSLGTIKVIKKAIEINKITNGSLDITIGPLVNLWGFGPELKLKKIPTDKEIKKRHKLVGIEKLSIISNSIIKTIPELNIDLSSIAKGYGVDVIKEYLESIGINNYMINIGGEISTKGKNGKKIPWQIAIEKPYLYQTIQKIIEPGEFSMATSGDYHNYFEYNGIHFSHIISPKTGKPIIHNLISVTVLSKNCMTADALSTGLNVLGQKKGFDLAKKMKIPIFMIIKTNKGFKELYTKEFKVFLKK
ncbi:FAD:protein FMN transferase [Candidatus Providencia siddallii]|uniref:FAD:protein FMN transferase n=1 Tax=Candidatus Providencia siddallii TaxID=1715285 RepID=A0ABP1CEA3_9GAMM